MEQLLNPYYLQIIMFMMINATLGLSIYFTLATGQLSLGNAGFMSVGAYTSALLTLKAGLPVYLAIPAGGLGACLLAAVIGIPATRLQGIYLAIATLGFGEVVRVVILNMKITNGALGLSGIPSMSVIISNWFAALGYGQGIAGLTLQQFGNISVIIMLALMVTFLVFFAVRLRYSRMGRAFAAIKADEHAAEVSGVNTTRYKLLAFFLGAFTGKQRRLEIARALATEPELVLLDEPAAGMNESETEDLRLLIGKIKELGKTVILIEHDMHLMMNVCERFVVLNFGKKIAEGDPAGIQENPEVIEAYLGKEDA